jgi:hypothetical protein
MSTNNAEFQQEEKKIKDTSRGKNVSNMKENQRRPEHITNSEWQNGISREN